MRMVRNGPNGSGVTFVWRELDPSLRTVEVQRLRLNPFGPAAPQRLRRATTNTLPPVTLRDDDARPGGAAEPHPASRLPSGGAARANGGQ